MTILTAEEIIAICQGQPCAGWIMSGAGTLEKGSETAVSLSVRIPEARNALRSFTYDSIRALDGFFNRIGWFLWLRSWNIGAEEYAQVGWRSCELMRRGIAELRSLEMASAHEFRSDEEIECRAFLLQVFLNQWEAVLIPNLLQYYVWVDEDSVTYHLPNGDAAAYAMRSLRRWEPALGIQSN